MLQGHTTRLSDAASSNYVELSPGGRGNRENNKHI